MTPLIPLETLPSAKILSLTLSFVQVKVVFRYHGLPWLLAEFLGPKTTPQNQYIVYSLCSWLVHLLKLDWTMAVPTFFVFLTLQVLITYEISNYLAWSKISTCECQNDEALKINVPINHILRMYVRINRLSDRTRSWMWPCLPKRQ